MINFSFVANLLKNLPIKVQKKILKQANTKATASAHNEWLIKFFPATISGGPAKIKAVQNIYKNLKFIPTGGLNKLNMNEYLNLANVLCVGMSKFNWNN